MEFVFNGQRRTLTAAEVTAKMKGVEPEAPHQHAVEIGGRVFPVKQVIAQVLAVDRLDFTSQQARSVLKRLGFRLFRHS